MSNIHLLEKRREAAVSKAKVILSRYADSGSEMTAGDATDYLELTDEIERVSTAIREERETDALILDQTRGMLPGAGSHEEARWDAPLPAGATFSELTEAPNRATAAKGFGEFVRAQSEGTTTEGGFLVPVALSAPILDLAVNELVMVKAGARLVPMSTNVVKVPMIDSDPTPAFRAEKAAITESSATFGQVTLTAKSLAVHVKASMEVLEDASPEELGGILSNSLARAFAQAMDRIALYGSGVAPEPRGVKNTVGVVVTNFTGGNGGTLAAATAYPALGAVIGRVKQKNYPVTGQIMSPRTDMQLGILAAADGSPLQRPAYFENNGLWLPTATVPVNLTVGTSNDTSDYFAGDFGVVLLGMRTRLTIVRLPLLLATGEVPFVGYMRFDVAVARPAAIEALAGLRA